MNELALPCPYYADARCRSCGWLELGRAQQLEQREAWLRGLLAPLAPAQWLPTVHGALAGFRHRAKLAVGGSADHPTLGLLDAVGEGIDLRDCPLYPPDMAPAFDLLRAFIKRARLTPYRVPKRRGELKYLLLNRSHCSGGLMLRFVLRSTEQLPRIREQLPWLLQQLPALQVVTANLQPRHMAVLEGEEELHLAGAEALAERLNDVPLYLRPRSFFQTHPEVAARLYATARAWVDALPVASLWDLYCGVGGFGLHCASGRSLLGVELAADAVASAQQSAREMGLADARFLCLDATAFARQAAAAPDLVLVNPPRRGIGAELCARIEALAPPFVLYSSCNPESLVQDALRLPGYRLRQVQAFEMFPHTRHCELLVLLERAAP